MLTIGSSAATLSALIVFGIDRLVGDPYISIPLTGLILSLMAFGAIWVVRWLLAEKSRRANSLQA